MARDDKKDVREGVFIVSFCHVGLPMPDERKTGPASVRPHFRAHRAFHEIPFLWRFHAVHHSIEHMDWIAGLRMHCSN